MQAAIKVGMVESEKTVETIIQGMDDVIKELLVNSEMCMKCMIVKGNVREEG